MNMILHMREKSKPSTYCVCVHMIKIYSMN